MSENSGSTWVVCRIPLLAFVGMRYFAATVSTSGDIGRNLGDSETYLFEELDRNALVHFTESERPRGWCPRLHQAHRRHIPGVHRRLPTRPRLHRPRRNTTSRLLARRRSTTDRSVATTMRLHDIEITPDRILVDGNEIICNESGPKVHSIHPRLHVVTVPASPGQSPSTATPTTRTPRHPSTTN